MNQLLIKYWIALFIAWFCSFAMNATAQVSSADSLAIFQLIRSANQQFYSHKDSALLLVNQAIEKSQKANFPNGLASAQMAKGDIRKAYSEYEAARKLYQQSQIIFKALNDLKGLSRIQTRIGLMEFIDGYTQKALNHYEIAKDFAMQAKDSLYIAASLMNMGGCHVKFGEYAKALPCYVDATEIFRLMGRTADWGMGFHYIAQLYDVTNDDEKALNNIWKAEKIIKGDHESPNQLFNLAYVYLTKGSIYLGLKDSVKQLVQIGEEMIALGTQLKQPMVLGNGLLYKGQGSKALGQRDSAFHYLHQGYSVLRDQSFQDELSSAALELGILYFEEKDLVQANQYLKESLNIEKKDSKNIDKLAQIYHYLNRIAKDQGNLIEAYQYLELHRQNQDSLYRKQTGELLAEVEAKYKTQEQETQLMLKESQIVWQQNLNIGIGMLAILLLFFGIFAYRVAQQRRKSNIILAQQAEKLQSLDRAKSRFFTNISHELRTPLQLILAPLEISIKHNKNKAIKEDLQLAHQNGKKLLTLVNEILDLSKLEQDKLALKEQVVHLQAFLRRILYSYHSLASLRGFILKFDYQLPEQTWLRFDPEKIEKIINNLLSNAFKYSVPTGSIHLKVSIAAEQSKAATNDLSEYLRIEVQDEGKGIAPHEIEKIFDRFYQIEGEHEPLQGGTGVGLALARELAQLSGGDLTVKSKMGLGSRFILTLPMKRTNPEEWPATKDFQPGSTEAIEATQNDQLDYRPVLLNGKKPKLLIVEDNPEMSQFLQRILSVDYDCTLAQDGQMGLELAQSQAFDLITSDVMMPNMDGFSFLEKLKAGQLHRQTPFILLTARALEQDRIRGLRLGVDDYVTKPFASNELMARIANLLKNKKQREEWWLAQQHPTEESTESLSFDEQLIKKAENSVLEQISNSKFTVEQLCTKLNYSRRQTERLIKKLTGLTPTTFIREIRLQQAQRYLLKKQFSTISEVAFAVGFEDPSYFSKSFAKRFGKKPSEVFGA